MKPLHSIVLLDCLRLFQNFNACYFRREWALSSRVNIDRCTSTAADVHRGSAVAVWRHLQPTAIQNTFRSLLKFNQLFSGPYSTYSQISWKSTHIFHRSKHYCRHRVAEVINITAWWWLCLYALVLRVHSLGSHITLPVTFVVRLI